MLLMSALGVLGFGAMAGPASAGIWSEIPTGTTEEISAIEYQSDTRFWFTTKSGSIYTPCCDARRSARRTSCG
jgi:hypothetical protein